jgi:hypothetical protein
MQSIQGPTELSISPTPYNPIRAFVYGRPVHVSPPAPGGMTLRVFYLTDTREQTGTWELLTIPATGVSAPDGFDYLTSVDLAGLIAHVFARRTS